MMEDNKSQMPDTIFSGMLDNGATYWCSHSVEGAAKIVGAKNATGYPETQYTRSDLVTELADALEDLMGDTIKLFHKGAGHPESHELGTVTRAKPRLRKRGDSMEPIKVYWLYDITHAVLVDGPYLSELIAESELSDRRHKDWLRVIKTSLSAQEV